MSGFPIFAPQEADRALEYLGHRDLGSLNYLMLRVLNGREFNGPVELLASAFLSTNALLMARSKRKIWKLVSLCDSPPEVFALMNALRYHLNDQFSALTQLPQWRAILEEFVDLPPNLFDEVQRVDSFLTESEIGATAPSYQRAEVFFQVEGAPAGGQQGVRLDFKDHFSVSVEVRERARRLSVEQVFVGDGFKFRAASSGEVILIEVDARDIERSVTTWVENLALLVDRRLFGFGL
jgi:hypothetical protein